MIRKVQKETGRIVQVETRQRSTFDKHVKAMAFVNEGRLGKITRVQAAIGGAPSSGAIPVVAPAEAFNWNAGSSRHRSWIIDSSRTKIAIAKAKRTAIMNSVGDTNIPAAS